MINADTEETVLGGERFTATLDDIEEFLINEDAKQYCDGHQ